MSPPYRVTYTGNGSQRDFQVPDDYIRRSHVTVTIAGVATSAYVWQQENIIRFNVAPIDGATIIITRTPPVDDPLNVFSRNTVITSKALNDNFRQSLQITERSLFADEADYSAEAGNAQTAVVATDAQTLTPGRFINGVFFDGSEDINIFADGENATFSDEAATAVRLKGNRRINGTVFNGTQDITITAAPTPYKEHKTVYVSESGVDNWAQRGYPRDPLRNIEYAIDQIGSEEGWTIVVMGDMAVDGEIVLPPKTTLRSHNLQRRSTLSPTSGNAESNCLLLNNGCHVYGFRFADWTIDDLENPTKGFGMAFAPGAIILPGGVPYGQNCVVGNPSLAVPTPLPGDPDNQNPAQAIGGGCVIADGSVLSAYSVYPNFMTWGFTPAGKNGIGYVARNRAHINCVNAIGVGAHIHFMCLDGGNMVLSACSSQFGDYSLWSEGSTTRVEPLKADPAKVVATAGTLSAIAGIKTALVAATLAYVNTLDTWTSDQQALIQKDTGLIADAIGVCLEFGDDGAMRNIADGFFKFDGTSVFPYAQLPDWKLSHIFIRDYIKTNTSFATVVDNFIDELFARLTATLDNYFYEVGDAAAPSPIERVRVVERSLLTAINHQWTAPLAGTQFFRVPPAKVARAIQRSIRRKDGGQVRFSGQDDQGNAVFVGGMTIDARSGELGGPPFEQAVRNRVTRNVIARSY